MEPAIVARNITKDFPSGDQNIRVLRGVTMNVPHGEMTMLVGPSGCGKTTLISVITGILSETEGDVVINGTDLTALSSGEKVRFRRENLGFIFQQFNLLPSLTAVENAAVVLIASGMNFEESKRHAASILSRIGMGDHLDKFPSQLSGGQQQRIAIARALAHNPKVVVCDEPTASLDAHTGQTVMEILREVALDPERAVIVVTHDNRIFHFADRIFTMGDGLIEREEVVQRGAA